MSTSQIRGNKQIKSITIGNDQIADGVIELDKLKEGSQLLKRDGSVVATGDFDLGSNQLKNVGAPVDANDAVRKADLDAVTNGSSVFREIPSGSLNGTNTQFSLVNEPNSGTEQVFLNGALLNAGANSDYVLEGSTITFTLAPQSGDVILVNYVTDAIVVSLDVNTSINQLNSRLTTAEGELFTAQNDITAVESDVSGLDTRLTTAEADIVAVEGDVASLQTSLSSVQSSVTSVQSSVSSEQAARIAADDALDTAVGSIQTSVTSLGNRMTAAEGDVTALEAADVAMDLRVGVLEDGLQAETSARQSADSALSSRVTALENAPDPVTALSALTDVTISSPSADQILKYNGTGWVNGAAPATFSGSYNDLTDTPSLFSGSYDDLTNKPTLFSGSYSDLTNKPNIALGAAQWTVNHTLADGTRYLVNDLVYDNGNIYKAKFDNESIPTSSSLYWENLGSGHRINIDGRDIPNIQYSQLSGKPSLADVATSGDYNDLTNKPSIPSLTQVEADIADHETRISDIESAAFVTREVPSGSVNGTNTEFTLANTPVSGTEQVFLNGILQHEGAGNDYTISGDTITFATAPESGWKLFVNYATGSYTVAPGGAGGGSITPFKYTSSEQVYPYEVDSDDSVLYAKLISMGTIGTAEQVISYSLSSIYASLTAENIYRIEAYTKVSGRFMPIPFAFGVVQYSISLQVYDGAIKVEARDSVWNSLGCQVYVKIIYKK